MPIRPDDFDASPARPTHRQGGMAVQEAGNATQTKESRAEEERQRRRSDDSRDDTTTTRWLTVGVLAVAVGLVAIVSAGPLHRYYLRLVSKQEITKSPKVPRPGGEHSTNAQVKPSSETQVTPAPPVQRPPSVEEPPSHTDKLPPPAGTPVVRKRVTRTKTTDHDAIPKVPPGGEGLNPASLAEQQAAIERERQRLASERAAIEAEKKAAEAANRTNPPTHTSPPSEAKVRAPDSMGTSPVPRPYHGPSSGHLYWEGNVNGTDLIEIEGNRSSSGTVTGDVFPYDVPCMVQTSDPKRVTIATPPSPSNHWNRIVLRIKANGYAKVTITWALP